MLVSNNNDFLYGFSLLLRDISLFIVRPDPCRSPLLCLQVYYKEDSNVRHNEHSVFAQTKTFDGGVN